MTSLYCVSYTNGIIGVFSSMEKVHELVLNCFFSLPFVIQVFKKDTVDNTDTDTDLVWIITYKQSDTVAYVTNNRDKASEAYRTLNVIGKTYEDSLEFCEQKIDTISDVARVVLESFQEINSKHNIKIDSSSNVINYML
jgi:hypothetical protein